jgi:RNA polymerase sigma-70 factor (ECF subfamily)
MDQETAWISEIKKENRKAFKQVYDQFADKVFYVAIRFHLDREEAKEIVQEVFLKLWEKRGSLKEDLSLNAFLLTIAKNKLINLHKKKAAELSRDQAYKDFYYPSSSSTEDYLIFTDLEKFTFQYIESLPARKKQIFLLSRKDGFTNEEIALQLNLSKKTVENNIYQAEKSIRNFLQENQLAIKNLVFILAWLKL